ncbi:MAG: phosphotransferase [Pseudomonadota bacterium]
MDEHFEKVVLQATGASALAGIEQLQSLWSGYGNIVRVALAGDDVAPQARSVVVKHVRWPTDTHHPRGWNTSQSHERKVKSYKVESTWYERWASRCDEACRVPQCLALETHGDEVFMVLEDLDAAGFDGRRGGLSEPGLKSCLAWLANFHATFMNEAPKGLWETGTYWHLDTRPDELEEMDHRELKAAARGIDERLNASPFQTLVHGDAKVANFCFTDDGRVAAVDFQYVGGGCGMKDVAYFLSSCLSEDECEQHEGWLLDYYFGALASALQSHDKAVDFTALETDWRGLYPVAWTDFFRFLQGWSPGHWKIHRYSRRLAREVLDQL